MNGSAEQQVRRKLPKALALALLVGGTGAFVNQQHQAHLTAGGVPQRVALDADPISETEQDGDHLLPSPPAALTVLTPDAPAAPATRAMPVPARAGADRSSRSLNPARPPLYQHRTLVGHHYRRTRSADDTITPDSPALDTPALGTHHGTGDLNWSALARCEAGGNPHAVDPSGRYGGLYQFDSTTWHRLGGHGRPQDAPADEQTARARRLYHQRGSSPWPACGHRAAG
ncbi:hypothetical protein ABH941_007082 [Streptacidiphilus sp. EB103A]